MDGGFGDEYDRLERSWTLLKSHPPANTETVIPIVEGVAFVKAYSTEQFSVLLGSSGFLIKFGTRREALECLQRQMTRLKLSWLESLEDNNDEAGLAEFERRFVTRTTSNREDGEVQDLVFFERLDSSTGHYYTEKRVI